MYVNVTFNSDVNVPAKTLPWSMNKKERDSDAGAWWRSLRGRREHVGHGGRPFAALLWRVLVLPQEHLLLQERVQVQALQRGLHQRDQYHLATWIYSHQNRGGPSGWIAGGSSFAARWQMLNSFPCAALTGSIVDRWPVDLNWTASTAILAGSS